MPADPYGARIRRARKQLRLTQQQLADKVGVSRNTVDSWENGRSYPKRYDVALEEVLGISLEGDAAPEPETEWERWERGVLESVEDPELARAIVADARRAARSGGPGPGAASGPSRASGGLPGGRPRAGG